MRNSEALVVAALDTSSDMLVCGVARIEPGLDFEGVETLAAGDHMCRRHANEELVNTLDAALSQIKASVGDIDAFLVGRGPGSFTGVRIGISTAKGLARGANVPLYGVSTLDAVAWKAWCAGVRGQLCVVTDAMRGEVYPARYELTEVGASRLFERERVVKVALAVEELQALPQAHELRIVGDGLVRYGKLFEEAGFAAQLLDQDLWWPSAQGLFLAWRGGDPSTSGAIAPSAQDDKKDGALHGQDGKEDEAPCDEKVGLSCGQDDEKVGQSSAWVGAGDPGLVLPIYTRLSDAEENERRRLGLGDAETLDTSGVADDVAGRHLQFRPMAAADAEAASKLYAACFSPETHRLWSPEMFVSELADNLSAPRSWWVVHDSGRLLAFAGGMVIDQDVEILLVAVLPEHRRQGIARKLLSHVSYDAQMLGCTTASLEVEAGNVAAEALYASLGFKQAGRRCGYYKNGADALILKANLPLKLPLDAASPEPSAAVMRTWPLPHPRRSADECARIQAAQPILAIESSCDETAVAIISSDGHILANQVSTSIDFHARFGGVVPEIASRKHVEAIVGVVDVALEEAAAALELEDGTLAPTELAAVGVTQGPGLVGALVVGVAFAKGFAYAAGCPLIAVNHLEGHLYANLLANPSLQPPFIFTLVSGGHTMLVHVRDWGDYEVLGQTLDDAVGEAFDKVAKALGLGYPGGPVISRLAEEGNAKAIDFPRAMMHSHDYRFSLSGLKTAVVQYIEHETKAGRSIHLPDLAASFEAAVFDVQFKKAWDALKQTGAREYCLGGGVAANPHLRLMMKNKLGRRGVHVTLPPSNACTDNAAMIAEVARRKFAEGDFANFNVDANPNMTL